MLQLNHHQEFHNSQLRHYCRHLRCRSKLKAPIDNPHKAFCARGCHSSFYLSRCLVCENAKPGPDWKFCRRPKCRAEYRRNAGLYDWRTGHPDPSAGFVISNSKSAHSIGIKTAGLTDRPWRMVAGAELSPLALHCATIPLDPALASRLTRQYKDYYQQASLIGPTDPPINILGGFKFPTAPVIDLNQPPYPAATIPTSDPALRIPNDLAIPLFLKRKPAS